VTLESFLCSLLLSVVTLVYFEELYANCGNPN
jgi:hypothetical protein